MLDSECFECLDKLHNKHIHTITLSQDEEIILTGVNYNPSRQIARDEAIARHLQAEFDREIMSLPVTSGPSLGRHQGVFPSVRVPRPVPAGPSVPSQSGRRQTRNSSNNG